MSVMCTVCLMLVVCSLETGASIDMRCSRSHRCLLPPTAPLCLRDTEQDVDSCFKLVDSYNKYSF